MDLYIVSVKCLLCLINSIHALIHVEENQRKLKVILANAYIQK